MNITKAIIPAAGLGTRFLPFTKAVPKEMLPILNIPAIQYIIQEGVDSHILDFFMITSETKQALKQYFQPMPELTQLMAHKNKADILQSLDTIIKKTTIHYINQEQPLGLGHAIAMARHSINDNYFGVFLPDDIIISIKPALAQLIAVAQKYNASVIAVQHVAPEAISSYGSIAPTQRLDKTTFEIGHVVEKPKPEHAPSNLAIIGRYVFHRDIFDAIDTITPQTKQDDGQKIKPEIQLTDAINHLIKTGKRVIAYQFEGNRYDLGQPAGWLQVNIDVARTLPEYKNIV